MYNLGSCPDYTSGPDYTKLECCSGPDYTNGPNYTCIIWAAAQIIQIAAQIIQNWSVVRGPNYTSGPDYTSAAAQIIHAELGQKTCANR